MMEIATIALLVLAVNLAMWLLIIEKINELHSVIERKYTGEDVVDLVQHTVNELEKQE